MSDYGYEFPPTQRSFPPAGFKYQPGWHPANDDDWYPLDENDNPIPTVISGYRRHGEFGGYLPVRSNAESGRKTMPIQQGSVIPTGWKATVDEPVPVIQCIEIKGDGNRCGRWSLRGGTKCQVHISARGKHEAARKVELARLRLVGMADDAINVLQDLIQPGTNDAIRLKAATEVLDRANIKGALDIQMEVQHKVDPASAVAQKLQEIADRRRASEDIQDAEIVDDGGDDND